MTSLLDIGPLTKEVTVGGNTVHVHGVTPEGMFFLLAKFPALQELFTRGSKNVDMTAMRVVAPECLAFALAVATTDRASYDTVKAWAEDVTKASKVAVGLTAHIQMAIFEAAVELTFPDGVGPFILAVDRLAAVTKRASGSTVPATPSSNTSRSGFVVDSPGMKLGKGAPRASSRPSKKSGLVSTLQ